MNFGEEDIYDMVYGVHDISYLEAYIKNRQKHERLAKFKLLQEVVNTLREKQLEESYKGLPVDWLCKMMVASGEIRLHTSDAEVTVDEIVDIMEGI